MPSWRWTCPSSTTDGLGVLDGAIGILPLTHDERPAVKDFVARHRAVFKADAGSHAALNFTGLNAVAAALRFAGTAIYEGHPRPGRGRREEPGMIVPLDAAKTGG